ncbi:sialin isoform X3 [Caretta caretta]|uniref:sialin isoform X3 n=1 Tax=Caretta caretta TaxID=8467 RepID=UPI003F4C0627
MLPLCSTSSCHLGKAPVYDWRAETQGVILSALFYGYLFTQLLGGYWSGQFGGKLVLGYGLLSTSALMLLVPLAAGLGAVYLIGLQALLGMAEGVIFPAQYMLLAKWAPPLERSRLIQLAVAGCTFGTFVTFPAAGIICQYVGWPYVFYIFGGIGCVWCGFWFLLVYEDPACHPHISAGEKEYIVSSLANQGISHGRSLPLLAMIKSLPLWAIAVPCFCSEWLFYTLLTSMPTYMHEVLHFDIRENGLLAALPYIGNWLCAIVSGVLADFLLSKQVFSIATVRKLFSVLGMMLPAISLVAVSYVGCDYTAAVVFLTLSMTVISMCGAGFYTKHMDIAPSPSLPCSGNFPFPSPQICWVCAGSHKHPRNSLRNNCSHRSWIPHQPGPPDWLEECLLCVSGPKSLWPSVLCNLWPWNYPGLG